MGSDLFVRFMRKRAGNLRKQQAPGPPPRPGLVWKPKTHRWIRPDSDEEYDHRGDEVEYTQTVGGMQTGRSLLANRMLDLFVEIEADLDKHEIIPPKIEQLAMDLQDLEDNQKHALSALASDINDIVNDAPSLIDSNYAGHPDRPSAFWELVGAVKSTQEEEKWSGLSEEHIVGGHDAARERGTRRESPGWGGTPDHPFHYD